MSLRILYVGNDLALYRFLKTTLAMEVVRCVGQSDAQLLLTEIKYSAVLLDETEGDLEGFIRELRIQKKTPVTIVSGSPESVAEAIRRSLIRPAKAPAG